MADGSEAPVVGPALGSAVVGEAGPGEAPPIAEVTFGGRGTSSTGARGPSEETYTVPSAATAIPSP